MGKNPPKWLPGDRVNETILLQRKSVEQLNADRLLRRDKLRESRERRKSKIDLKRKAKLTTKKFITAQTILKHAQRKLHQNHRFAKAGERFEGRAESALHKPVRAAKYAKGSVALVVRAKGKLIPRDVTKAFHLLGLDKIYSARFLHMNPSTDKLLHQLKAFCIAGFPDKEQVEQLIRTRGHFWNEETKTRRVISGNAIIEKTLGDCNILCVEDLAYVLTTGDSPHMDVVLRHLAPFDFHPPHQMFMERHRTAHQKLEIVNPEGFAAYLGEQLKRNVKREKKTKKDAKKSKATPAKKQ